MMRESYEVPRDLRYEALREQASHFIREKEMRARVYQ